MPVPQQGQLFDTHTYEAKRDYTPGTWEQSPDIVWRSSGRQHFPAADTGSEHSTGSGYHSGTKAAAIERARDRKNDSMTTGQRDTPSVLHPLQLGGSFALPVHDEDDNDLYAQFGSRTTRARVGRGQVGHSTWADDPANFSSQAREAIERGHSVPYINEAEDRGSVSYRSPRANLKTWGEAVMADKNAPSRYRAAASQGFDYSHSMEDSRPPQQGEQNTLDQVAVHEQYGRWPMGDIVPSNAWGPSPTTPQFRRRR